MDVFFALQVLFPAPEPLDFQGVFPFSPLLYRYCTMLYEAGIDLKTAQRWMGHVDEKKILRIYAHLTERQEQKAVEKLKEFMAG